MLGVEVETLDGRLGDSVVTICGGFFILTAMGSFGETLCKKRGERFNACFFKKASKGLTCSDK
jgi:hypothetical protein